jgi:hypothetical protein
VLEPDLNGRSYGAVYVTDDFGATATDTGWNSAALLPQWRRQHPSSCGTQTAVSFSSASTPTARGPGLTLSPGYIVLLGQLTGPDRYPVSNVVYYSADAGATSSLNATGEDIYSFSQSHHRCLAAQIKQSHCTAMTFQHSQPHGGGL